MDNFESFSVLAFEVFSSKAEALVLQIRGREFETYLPYSIKTVQLGHEISSSLVGRHPADGSSITVAGWPYMYMAMYLIDYISMSCRTLPTSLPE